MAYQGFNNQKFNQPAMAPGCVIDIAGVQLRNYSWITVKIITSRVTELHGASLLQVNLSKVSHVEAAVYTESILEIHASTVVNVTSELHSMSEVNVKIVRSTCIMSQALYGISCITSSVTRARSVAAVLHSQSYITAEMLPSYTDAINSDSREFTVRVEIYIDPNEPIVLDQSSIEYFSLLEELKADTRSPMGTVTSNEFVLAIDNYDKRFSPTNMDSDLFGKLVPGIMLKAYLALVLGENYTVDIPLGTYYTGDWDAPSENVICSVVSHDRLYSILNMPFDGMRVVTGETYGSLFERVLALAGISATEYTLDQVLYNTIVNVAHVPKGTIGSGLKYVSEASGSYVYVNRDNIVEAKVVNYNAQVAAYLDDTTQILNSSIPTRYLETYSKISIPYYLNDVSKNVSVLSMTEYELEPGDNILDKLSLTNSPVGTITKIELKGAPSIKVKYYEATADTLTVCINNPGAKAKIDIRVYGDVYTFTSVDNSTVDEALKVYVEDKELRIENKLIQTKQHSDWFINRMKVITSNPNSFIDLNIRGNPAILPSSIVAVKDTTKLLPQQHMLVTRSRIEYRGALSQSLSGYIIPREVI